MELASVQARNARYRKRQDMGLSLHNSPTYISYDFISLSSFIDFFLRRLPREFRTAIYEILQKFRSELFALSYCVATTIRIVDKFVDFIRDTAEDLNEAHPLLQYGKQEVISYFQDIIIPPYAYAQRRLRNLRYL